jgi:ABC-2 type transport system ATP-binding protein
MHVLEICNLSKSFGSLKAVDDVSFEVPEGSIFGLIGRNGAGKTTTIRMMMNIYLPDSGEVILRGTRIGAEIKDVVGYLPEERGLYPKMKVLETLLFFAGIKGKNDKDLTKRAKEYLERFDLSNRMNAKIEELSKGNQQKIQFIISVLHDPEIIMLDEPFSGLDPINTNLLKDIILEKKREGRIVILSTHLMDFAEKLCDHLAMIDHGRIILHGSLSDIKSSFSQRNVTLGYEGDISFLKDHQIVEKISDFGNATGIKVKEAHQTQELLRLLVANNIKVNSFVSNNISLQEIFIQLAGNHSNGDMKHV